MGCRDGRAQPGKGILARHRRAVTVLDFVQYRRQSIGKDRKRLALDFLGFVPATRCERRISGTKVIGLGMDRQSAATSSTKK